MTQSAASTVDPQKWLATFQRWCPAVPMAEHVAFINSWIEVAGPHRVEWINAYIEQADNQQRRTGAWKIKRVKQRAEDMAKNPQRMPWLRKLRGSPDIDVVLKILRTAGRGLRAGEILRAFPRDRGMTLGALNNVLLGMKANDLIEQYSDGVYGIPRLGVEPYESGTRRIFKSALKVPKEEETTRAALCEATGWNRARVGAAINNLRDRGLFDPERIAVSAWARAKTEYNETISTRRARSSGPLKSRTRYRRTTFSLRASRRFAMSVRL